MVEERRFAHGCVAEWNAVHAERMSWAVELLGWEDTLPQAGRPQALINPDVERSLLFVGMMHRHWGDVTGSGHTSGFHEEFTLACELFEKTGKPRIALFFKHPGAIQDPGIQLKQVLSFKETIKQSKRFLYKEFEAETAAWQTGFRQNLHRTIFEVIDELEQLPVDAEAAETAGAPPDPVLAQTDVGEDERLLGLRALVDRLADPEQRDQNSVVEIARLRLIASSWPVSGLSEAHLGTHDANVIFRAGLDGDLSSSEALGLIDSGLAHISTQTTPLWRWLAHKDDDLSYTRAIAVWGDDDTLRIGALKVLTAVRAAFTWDPTIIAERFADAKGPVRNALIEYLSALDDSASLEALRVEHARADYATEGSSVAGMFRRLSRQSRSEALQFLIRHNASLPMAHRRKMTWDGLAELEEEDIRLAFSHRDATLREEAALILARRGLLTAAEKLALRSDPSASLRAASVLIALEDGEVTSLPDCERIVVRRSSNALAPAEGARQHERVRFKLLETYSDDALAKEVEALFQPAQDAYEILLRRNWKSMAARARQDIRDNFQDHFDSVIARRRATLGDAVADLTLPNDRELIYEFRASHMVRSALNVIGEKAEKADLPLFRQALASPYFTMSERDFEVFGKYGEWSDIPNIARASRSSGGSLLIPDVVVPVEVVARAILKIAGRRTREVLELELPDVVRSAMLKLLSKAAFSGLPDTALFRLFNETSDDVRRTAAIRAARDLSRRRCVQILDIYNTQATYYYNVMHWLDLAVSMPRALVDTVTFSHLSED